MIRMLSSDQDFKVGGGVRCTVDALAFSQRYMSIAVASLKPCVYAISMYPGDFLLLALFEKLSKARRHFFLGQGHKEFTMVV